MDGHPPKPTSRKRFDSGRQKARREADFAVRNSTARREPISSDLAAQLFHAIDSNNLTGFGIRALARLAIDELLPSPEGIAWEPRVTLLGYAAWRQRPRFIKSLLRAGADPSVRWDPSTATSKPSSPQDRSTAGAEESIIIASPSDGSTCVQAQAPSQPASLARRALESVPVSFAVWVVIALSRMRLAGRMSAEHNQSPLQCTNCLSTVTQPVAWPCGHVTCEPCFWRQSASAMESCREPFCCVEGCAVLIECPLSVTGPDGVSSSKTGQAATRRAERARQVAREDLDKHGHPDDWDCNICKYRNFSYRSTCRSCGAEEGNHGIVGAIRPHLEKERDSVWSRGKPVMSSVAMAACLAAVSALVATLGSERREAQAVFRPYVFTVGLFATAGWCWAYFGSQTKGKLSAPSDPESIRQTSLAKWMELPSDGQTNGNAVQVDTKPGTSEAFRPMRLADASAALLGHTREKRTEALHDAAAGGNILRLKALISAGVDINAINEYGQSAFFIATLNRQTESLVLLAASGADVNLGSHGGARPSTVAAAHGSAHVLELLQSIGVDWTLTGCHGLSPVEYATATGNSHVRSAISSYLTNASVGLKLDGLLHHLDKEELQGTMQVLIDPSVDHVGAGSYLIDNALSEGMLERIEHLWGLLPRAVKDCNTKSGSDDIIHRSYFCDGEGWLCNTVSEILRRKTGLTTAHPCMRFLHYFKPGGLLPPHLDLSKTTRTGDRSTHTLLIYLKSCTTGGETVLLESLKPESAILAKVQPKRGRILVFPHACPHRADAVVEVPKIVLRGEVH